MIKKKKQLKMSLALVVLGVLIMLGCSSSSNSTDGDGSNSTGGDGSNSTDGDDGSSEAMRAPVIVDSNPVDGSNRFSIAGNLKLTYSEAVVKGSGSITLKPASETAIAIAVTRTHVSFLNRLVTIDPPQDLTLSTEYVLTIPAGAFVDTDGNGSSAETISFTTADVADITPPVVVSSVPASGGTIGINSNIVLTYSEEVQRGAGNFLFGQSPAMVLKIPVNSLNVSIAGRVVTINPSSALPAGDTSGMTIPAGVIEDLAGNPAVDYMLAFNTLGAADTIPYVMSSVPSSGDSIDRAADIALTYSESVQKGTGNITITPAGSLPITIPVGDAQVSIADDGRVVTINPSADLTINTAFILNVDAGALESSDNQISAEEYNLGFTTNAVTDTTAPTVSSSVPAGGGTIDATANIKLIFSEAVQAGTGDIMIVPSGGETLTIAVSDSQVSISDNAVIINPTTDLLAGTTYALTVPAGAIKDLAANGLATPYLLDFNTAAGADNTAPTLSSSVPAMGSTAFFVDSNIALTFSEAVQVGTGNITITPSATSSSSPQTIAVSSARVSVEDSVVTIDPPANLAANTLHTLSFAMGAIEDLAGNAAAGGTLTFTATEATRTIVLWLAPTGYTGNIATFADCPLNASPSVAAGTVFRPFLASGTSNNQNPVNFTIDNTAGGTTLAAYTGRTPVYAANSATSVLTANELIADSYADFLSPTTPLLRTLNAAGLNGEDQRISADQFPFWTGITNAANPSRYEIGQACRSNSVFWNSGRTENSGNIGVGNLLTRFSISNPSATTPNTQDVFSGQALCTEKHKILCVSY